MRNNPKYNPEMYENNDFRNFSERIRKKTLLTALHKTLVDKFLEFSHHNINMTIKVIDTIVKTCDESLQFNGNLLAAFVIQFLLSNHQHLNPKIILYKENKEDIPVEQFFNEFQDLLVQNNEIKEKAIKEKMLPAIGIKH